MTAKIPISGLLLSVFLLSGLAGFLSPATATEGMAFFEKEVRPILVARCYECHSEESGKRKGGLWLDRKQGWAMGGDSGPTLIPGDVEGSLLVHSIRYRDEALQMPPKERLSPQEAAVLEEWVRRGAPDPRDEELAASVRKQEIDFEAARKGWAYRPHQNPAIPALADPNWGRTPVDEFVLAQLESRNLKPTIDADPRVLLRRLHYDLNGLPPTPEEVDSFVADPSPGGLEQVVDDLLHRPAFGEKWGRHWLDVVRYADSNGGDRNFTFHQAWRYRNYVISALNQNRSYYQFLREQIAGDLLPWTTDRQREQQLIGSTFLALGPKMLTERNKEKLRLDTADEQIDTLGRAFLGLTMGCARCHDHKFDPISQEDYYALGGIFRSTQVVLGTRNGCVNVASWVETPLPVPEPRRSELEAQINRLELAMRLTVEKSFKKKAGGKMTLDNLPLAGVIYDEADAELIGSWKESTFSSNRFGAGYVHDDQKGKGENQAIFRASLPENGTYEVRIAYNAAPNRAPNVPISVEAWDRVHEVTLDETRAPEIGGLFQPVGRFHFEKGGRANLIIGTAGTDHRYVIVDAVQFIAVEDIEREAAALAAAKGKGGDPLFQMNDGELRKELGKMIKDLRGAELAMAPRDAKDSDDLHLRIRGEVGQRGPKIPRNFPQVLHSGSAPEIPQGQSGRLQLAEWITSPDLALLDRVIVNRIWHHLFGRGIVATVDNFGALGSPPTHPELLDYLASDFRASDGSIKSLVRKLVLSRTYQLSVNPSSSLEQGDPTNNLFGRQIRRRLTAEEIRDSLLFLSGKLNPEPGAATATRYGEDLDDNIDLSKDTRRTVYLPVARNNLVAEMAVFDAANPDLVSGNRPATTVPTQALFLLNSSFFLQQSALVGNRNWNDQAPSTDSVTRLYQSILGRPPTSRESDRADAFLRELTALKEVANPEASFGHLAHLLLASTEFLFLD